MRGGPSREVPLAGTARPSMCHTHPVQRVAEDAYPRVFAKTAETATLE